MTPNASLQALEMLYAVGIPALFWAGLVAGVAVSAASSSPYFLGNSFFTRAYIGVVILFVTNLIHRFLGLPYFFGSMGLECSLIIAAEVLFFILWSAANEAASRKMAASDPNAQICPKCRTIIDTIFRVCPRCDTQLPDEDTTPKKEGTPGK